MTNINETERQLVATETEEQHRLRLHEERAVVQVLREAGGTVTLRRVVEEREERIPVTLRHEYLQIDVLPGAGQVRLGETLLDPGTHTVELLNERAVVGIEAVAVQDVVLHKRAIEETHQETVSLRRETVVLDDPQQLVANPEALQ